MTFAQARKAFVPFLVAQIPAVLAVVTAKWGATVASEVAGILAAFGVFQVKNEPAKP